MHGSREPYQRDGLYFDDYHFLGIIRNASLQPNTIVRIYLVVWQPGKITQYLRFGHGEKSITDRATNEPLMLPLHLEARSAKKVEVVFDVRLTDSKGKVSTDGRLSQTMVPIHSHPGYATHKYTFELVFEDAAANYFDQSGRLLSLKLVNLNWTLQNYKGRRRIFHYNKIASAWIEWKLAILRSWFGFYR
jgi:hypothetical protein